jgi:predicted MFS family arabinose efflux permease
LTPAADTRSRNSHLAPLVFAAALAFTLSMAGSALKSTVTVLKAGTVLSGVAFLLCALAPNVLAFVPTYGVLGSIAYTMLSYVPLGKLADELFAGRGEGLAYAVMTDGPAVGFIVLVPLWVWLGTLVSWRAVFAVAGVLMLVVLTPLAVLLGRLSGGDGDAPVAAAKPAISTAERVRTVLGNRRFGVVALAFGGCGVTMAFVDVHLVADLHMAGMDSNVVSGALALLGAFEIVGSLVAGRLCDRGLIRSTLVVGYLLRGVAMMLLVAAPTTGFALAFGVVFGASYMVTVIATTLWVGRILPAGVRATGMGLVWLVHQAGAALSSQLGAFAAQRSGSYGPVALAEAGVVLLSALAVFWLPRPGGPDSPAGGLLLGQEIGLAVVDPV